MDDTIFAVIDDNAGIKDDNPASNGSSHELKLDNISSGIGSKSVVFESKLIEKHLSILKSMALNLETCMEILI